MDFYHMCTYLIVPCLHRNSIEERVWDEGVGSGSDRVGPGRTSLLALDLGNARRGCGGRDSEIAGERIRRGDRGTASRAREAGKGTRRLRFRLRPTALLWQANGAYRPAARSLDQNRKKLPDPACWMVCHHVSVPTGMTSRHAFMALWNGGRRRTRLVLIWL